MAACSSLHSVGVGKERGGRGEAAQLGEGEAVIRSVLYLWMGGGGNNLVQPRPNGQWGTQRGRGPIVQYWS